MRRRARTASWPTAATLGRSERLSHDVPFAFLVAAAALRQAKFGIGQVVKHRVFNFRGVIFDVDPVFANTEEWWQAIPAEVRPHKDQPFYHLLAENDEGGYVAYVSEQNLLPDTSGEPVGNPNTSLIFDGFLEGQYHLRPRITH